MKAHTQASENSLTIRRTIRAPRQRVFDAWTQPAFLANWWRVNPTWTTPIVEIDLRVGGKYRLGMQNPDKPTPHVCYGEFQEVDPPRRLVYTWSWEPPDTDIGKTLVTVEFHADGNTTEIVLRHEQFPDAKTASEHSKGWTGCINVLAERVEKS